MSLGCYIKGEGRRERREGEQGKRRRRKEERTLLKGCGTENR